MGVFYKFVVENLLSTQKMFDNDIANLVVTGFILLVSFIPAWNSVEWLYDNKLISTRNSGSLIHWVIRLVVGLVIFFTIKIILVTILFVKTYWIQVVIMALLGIAICFSISYCIKQYNGKKVKKEMKK